MRTISQRDLRNDNAAIIRAVEAGESFVVTRNGVAAAELRPLRRRTSVPARDALATVQSLPRIDAVRFREDVDLVLDQRLSSE